MLYHCIVEMAKKPQRKKHHIMNYFKNITEVQAAKLLYRELSKIHHPDKGGDVEIMKSINNEYDFICAQLLKGNFTTQENFDSSWESCQLFKDKINAVVNMEGIVIELVGLWIWITGDTRTHKEGIKAAGYFWASKKAAWFWRPASAAGGRGKHSLDFLKNKYGCQTISGKRSAQLA